jgi:hypothetical protein
MPAALRSGLRRTLPVLIGCLLISGGCSVLEVIDGIGKDSKPPKPTAKDSASADPALPPVPEGSAKAKLRAYYNRKPAKAVEEDPNNPIVRCGLQSGTQFMRKYDCDLRGGRSLG